MNQRRRLVALAALAATLPAWAQAGRKVTIAMLLTGRSPEDEAASAGFIAQMRRLGWVEGQNASYRRFFTEGVRERADEIAKTAAQSKPDLIYTSSGGGVAAAMKATSTIPIIFITVSDPVAGGMAESLRRPGQNATGVFQMGTDVISKRLELIHEALPRVRRVGVLLDARAGDYAVQKREHENSPRPKALSIVTAEISRFEDVASALDRLKKDGGSVFIMSPSFTLASRRRDVVALALERRMVPIAYRSDWVELGALLSYGADVNEVHQRSAEMADRLLRGTRPADMPIERATKFQLVVNVRTAKTLGITLPKSILQRADRIIE
jgi:putative ABC transport system substrate-binding protein